jgi:hypothetical protein
MSTPVTGAVTWQTPVTINSGDIVTATDLNALNKDVAWMHARPWTIVNQTGAGTAIGNPVSQILFGGSGSGTYSVTNSATAVGSITLSAASFSVPIAGMYRITASVGAAATSGAHWRLRLVGQNAGSPVWQYSGQVVNGQAASGDIDISTVSVLVPVGTASSSVPLGNATSFYLAFDHLDASGAATIQALGTQASNFYPTSVQIEYTGISANGAY